MYSFFIFLAALIYVIYKAIKEDEHKRWCRNVINILNDKKWILNNIIKHNINLNQIIEIRKDMIIWVRKELFY